MAAFSDKRTQSIIADDILPASGVHEEGPGTFFLGRYRVVDEIGVGGMASVHLARADGPGGFQKWVAIKRVHAHLAEEENFVEMFLDEARIAARISHANVAQVFELGQSDGTYWIAMEYLHGEPLREIMRCVEDGAPRTPTHLASKIIADAAEGLHAAHDLRGKDGELLGLVHRDVTPHNLFVTYDGTTKVVDFGIAKVAGRLSQTKAGTLKGKLAYMSPEQVRGAEIDRRTDIFALGVVLWELTTGKRLFRADSEVETLERVQACMVPLPSSIVPDYPPELEAVVMKALAKTPDQRYQTARDFCRAILQHLLRRGTFVGPEEVATYVRNLFADRIRKRDAHLRWAAEVTHTINVDRPSSPDGIEEVSASSYESNLEPPRPAAGRPANGDEPYPRTRLEPVYDSHDYAIPQSITPSGARPLPALGQQPMQPVVETYNPQAYGALPALGGGLPGMSALPAPSIPRPSGLPSMGNGAALPSIASPALPSRTSPSALPSMGGRTLPPMSAPPPSSLPPMATPSASLPPLTPPPNGRYGAMPPLFGAQPSALPAFGDERPLALIDDDDAAKTTAVLPKSYPPPDAVEEMKTVARDTAEVREIIKRARATVPMQAATTLQSSAPPAVPASEPKVLVADAAPAEIPEVSTRAADPGEIIRPKESSANTKHGPLGVFPELAAPVQNGFPPVAAPSPLQTTNTFLPRVEMPAAMGGPSSSAMPAQAVAAAPAPIPAAGDAQQKKLVMILGAAVVVLIAAMGFLLFRKQEAPVTEAPKAEKTQPAETEKPAPVEPPDSKYSLPSPPVTAPPPVSAVPVPVPTAPVPTATTTTAPPPTATAKTPSTPGPTPGPGPTPKADPPPKADAGGDGFLTVVCQPQACDSVSANGRQLGPSPVIRKALPAGTVRLVMKHGSTVKNQTVTMTPDATTALRVNME